MRSLLSLSAIMLAASPAMAETRSGPAEVIDGDTVEIEGKRIRLFGIDAPEATQLCYRGSEIWACGEAAASELRGLINGNELSCRGYEIDQFGRFVAVCTIAGMDLGKLMVAQGWAIAFRRYSDDYVADQARAQASKLGMWNSTFVSPEEHRAAERGDANPAPAAAGQWARIESPRSNTGCTIKGNRSRRGEWIYHLPGMPYYEETRAEEMFCSEAEAQAAGYRRSRAR
jgi:endonuclease YncB( thermonuclease family)